MMGKARRREGAQGVQFSRLARDKCVGRMRQKKRKLNFDVEFFKNEF